MQSIKVLVGSNIYALHLRMVVKLSFHDLEREEAKPTYTSICT